VERSKTGRRMDMTYVARQAITIGAPISRIWDAFVNPAIIKQYMFGTTMSTSWQKGSPISWKGEWQGKEYEDKGTVLEVEKEKLLKFTHFSPLSGLPDRPENYHTVVIDLRKQGDAVVVSLSQDNNPTEEARKHSEDNWKMVLEGVNNIVER
jgi:uncharacterized protein YndB with AHSA1/START domain